MFIPTKTYVKERSFDWAHRIWIQKHAGIPGYPAKTIEQCSKGLLARSSDNGLYEQLPVYITPAIIDQQRFWITAQLVFGIDHQLYGHVALHPANSFLKLSFSEKKNWASSNVLIIFHINGKYSISKLPKGIEILDVFRRKSYSSYKKRQVLPKVLLTYSSSFGWSRLGWPPKSLGLCQWKDMTSPSVCPRTSNKNDTLW